MLDVSGKISPKDLTEFEIDAVTKSFQISVGQSANVIDAHAIVPPPLGGTRRGTRRKSTPGHEIKPTAHLEHAPRDSTAFEVFGRNCPSNFITPGFKMMEGLSGISPDGACGARGSTQQPPTVGRTLIKKARRGWFAAARRDSDAACNGGRVEFRSGGETRKSSKSRGGGGGEGPLPSAWNEPRGQYPIPDITGRLSAARIPKTFRAAA